MSVLKAPTLDPLVSPLAVTADIISRRTPCLLRCFLLSDYDFVSVWSAGQTAVEVLLLHL